MAEGRSPHLAGSRLSLIVAFSLALSACAAVDRFGPRIYDHNLTSQDAINEETLLNIVRASRYQPMNFMAVTQVNGGQTETLTSGLPTITFGPAQTAAQHQFIFSNSLASAINGGYQTNPLVSSQFQQGMISPVTPKLLAYLLASHDRETVFDVVIDNIEIKSGSTTVRYVNDPSNDEGLPEGCSPDTAQKVFSTADAKDARMFLLAENVCNYSKFVIFLKEGLDFGLSAELVMTTSAKGTNGGGSGNSGGNNSTGSPTNDNGGQKNATTIPQAQGQMCWDPGLAEPQFKQNVNEDLKDALCNASSNTTQPPKQAKRAAGGVMVPGAAGSGGKGPQTTTTTTGFKVANFQFPFQKFGNLQFDVSFRSPQAIFIALGRLLRNGLAARVTSRTKQSQREFRGEPLLTIAQSNAGQKCYITASYDGDTYCVPQGAYRTAMVIDVLEQLRNLSITPNDLNSAFSVRLID